MKRIYLAVLLVIFLAPMSIFALDGVEILSGYLHAELERQGDYDAVPLFVGLNFDLKPALSNIGLEFPGRFDFVLEPFVNTVYASNSNVEVGSNFLVKYVLPLTDRVQPYIKGGVGALYMSMHTDEQSTQYNFLPQGGGGVHIFINEKTALTFEYRYRHLSNASTSHPNSGIDADLYLGGISFFFE